MIASAVVRSPSRRAWVALPSASVTMPASRTMSSRIRSRSWWNVLRTSTAMAQGYGDRVAVRRQRGERGVTPSGEEVGPHRLDHCVLDAEVLDVAGHRAVERTDPGEQLLH